MTVKQERQTCTCDHIDMCTSAIVDSRPFNGGARQRRRRGCAECGGHMTTIELDATELERLEQLQKGVRLVVDGLGMLIDDRKASK